MRSAAAALPVRRRALALALALTSVVAMGGCTSDDEPEPGTASSAPAVDETTTDAGDGTAGDEEPTTEPAPDESHPDIPPPPAEPVPPAAMDDLGPDGAEAAARYFLEELLEYSTTTADFTQWEAMTYGDLCDFCTHVNATFNDIDRDEYTIRGGGVTLSNVETGDRDSLYGLYPVFAYLTQEDQQMYSPKGEATADVATLPSGEFKIEVANGGSGWRVMSVVDLSQP